jgi:hypothetical protein
MVLNASRNGRGRLDRYVPLTEIIICEVERNGSTKVFKLLAEGVR